jgi:hypothetical protein
MTNYVGGSQHNNYNYGNQQYESNQYNQYGDHSVGKNVTHGNALSDQERARAISELDELINYLKSVNLISPTGQLSDNKAVEAAIAHDASKLKTVAHAISSGTGQVLSTALNQVAAPVLLKIIAAHFGLN